MTFEEKIKTLAMVFPLSVTSWIRSRKHNLKVGGVPDSRHLHGLAVDIVLDDMTRKPIFTYHAKQLGLQVIEEGDHVHVQEPRATY